MMLLYFLLKWAMFFTMFSNSLVNTDGCQVIPPGLYKLAVWDEREAHGEVSEEDCDRIFKQLADGQTLLKTMALDDTDYWKMCFKRLELVTTDKLGRIDPYNVTFYNDGKSFCAIKHKFNIHLMPLDENKNLLPSELYPECPLQTFNAKVVTNIISRFTSKTNKYNVHYHEEPFEFLEKLFDRWENRERVKAEDLFMLKAYLNGCLQHDANHAWEKDDLDLLRLFGKDLHEMVKLGKLTIRSQLAMAAMAPIQKFCNTTNKQENKVVRDELNRWALCKHVNVEMANHAHILAMFQRWLLGEFWAYDAFNLNNEFSSLMSNIMENNKMINAKTKTLIAQIGFIVIKALNKTQLFENSYKPKFDVIVCPLAQLCELIITNIKKISNNAHANTVWRNFCAQFIEQMWHLWFIDHGIQTQIESDDKPGDQPKKLVFNITPKPSFLIKTFLALFDGSQQHEEHVVMKQQMSLLNRIGNVLELALDAYPVKTLEVMHKYSVDKIVCKFCIARPPGRTTPKSSSWLVICELIQWEKWMNLTSDLFLAEMHDQIAGLVGDAEVNCLKKMDLVDKTVLNIIGSLLMAKVLRDDGKTFLKFTKLAEKTICKFCANRTAQFHGWNHICVYNMWLLLTAKTETQLFECNKVDEMSLKSFQQFIDPHPLVLTEKTAALLNAIGNMLAQNLNGKNRRKIDELLEQLKDSISLFCSSRTPVNMPKLFVSWDSACERLDNLLKKKQLKRSVSEKKLRRSMSGKS